MTKKEKEFIVDRLADKFSKSCSFYIVNPGGLRAEQVNMVRRSCFQRSVEYRVAKNTFLFKALVKVLGDDYIGLDYGSFLKGSSGVFFINEEDSISFPARLLKSVSKGGDLLRIPLKCAFVDREMYIGNEHLDMLSSLKSKNEMIGEMVLALKGSLHVVLSSLERRVFS